ncbi:hypothetical protein LTR53_013550 [Teratosphaeriaceae sp. CCFEE 6253]|nr:hypothetical protein LTR53_013550 [Teratosphaeriaceae sp. CCFEE 6253]
MVQLSIVRAANRLLAQDRPLVAVFVGATSGIGEYTLLALARTHGDTGKGLRVYLVGRSAGAAKKITLECQTLCPSGDFRFVQVKNLTLLHEADACCKQIIKLEEGDPFDGSSARVDILCMSQGYLRFGAAEITSEGLEVSMALLFYTRMRFTLNLMPLLINASSPAHVISVFGAGMEKGAALYKEDLSLAKDPARHYSVLNVRVHVAHITTMYFEHLAQQHAGKLSLVHVFPGLVVTPAFSDSNFPWWSKGLWFLLGPIARWFIAVGPEEIGERVLFLATPRYPGRQQTSESTSDVAMGTDGARGGGAYSCNWNGETNDIEKLYTTLREQGFRDQVREHVGKVCAAIDAQQQFEE